MTWSALLHRRWTGRNPRNRSAPGGVLPLQQILFVFTLADQPGSNIFPGRASSRNLLNYWHDPRERQLGGMVVAREGSGFP